MKEGFQLEVISSDSLEVCLAKTDKQIENAQKLRYKIFFEEMGGIPSEEAKAQGIDKDPYDEICDHLLVFDRSIKDTESQVVGTYRLLRGEIATKNNGFYTETEFNIDPLINSFKANKILELGRSCVLPEYRTKPTIKLLWRGIAAYIQHYDIELMFGCASFSEIERKRVKKALSFLQKSRLAPEKIRPKALGKYAIEIEDIKIPEEKYKKVISKMPPLIKAYLRVGCYVGKGAIFDSQCKTIDVCIVLETKNIPDKYRSHYLSGRDES